MDNASLTYKATLASGAALPSWLSFDAATRTFSGTPPQNYNGSIDLTVTASDGLLNTTDTFTLTVTPVNDAPVVAAPTADQRINEDTPWSFQVPAGAFKDVESANLTYTATLANGSSLPAWLGFNASTRTFAGTPPQDTNGSVEVRVTASDGTATVSDTFTLTIDPVNDAPVVRTPIADQSTPEDTAWTFQVPANVFADVDSSLIYTAALANGGTLPNWLSFNTTTRTFSGTPPEDFSGSIDLTITANDGALSTSDTFTLTITPTNDAPVVKMPIGNQFITEDTAWTFQVPTNAFADVDSSSLTYTATLSDGVALPSWLTFDAATGTFSGTPPRDFSGDLELKVTASDGSLSVSDTFRLTIDPVNDAPIVSTPITDVTILEEAGWTFQVPADTFDDVDGSLSYTATLADGATLPSWLTFDASARTFSGTPPLDFSGAVDLKITASDGEFAISDTFTLNVLAVDNPPVVTPIADQTVAEDTPWLFTLPANAFVDPDSSGLTYMASLADGAALPPWLRFDEAAATFSGTPPLDFTGSFDLKVTAKDGTSETSSTFKLIIDPVNDAPVAAPIANQSVAEDTPWTFQLPAGAFSDVDSTSLTYTAALSDGSALPAWLSFDAQNGTFTGTPPLDSTDTIDLTVSASDGLLSASETFRLTITPVNDAPVGGPSIGNQSIAEDTQWTFQVPASTFDDVDSTLTYLATLADGAALPSWLTFDAATQTFSGTPPQNFTGSLDLTVTANDGFFALSDTFTLTVTPANDAPAAAPIPNQTIAEDALWTFQIPAGTFSDTDSASLTYTTTLSDGSALPEWLSFDTVTGTFSGTPPLDSTGTLDLTVSASDGSLDASETFRLTVTPVNDAPVVGTAITNQSISEDTAWTFQVPAQAFTDVDSDSLIYSATMWDGTALPPWLAFDAATQTFMGKPPLNYTGSLDLKISASDGSLSTSDHVHAHGHAGQRCSSDRYADRRSDGGRECGLVVPGPEYCFFRHRRRQRDLHGGTLRWIAASLVARLRCGNRHFLWHTAPEPAWQPGPYGDRKRRFARSVGYVQAYPRAGKRCAGPGQIDRRSDRVRRDGLVLPVPSGSFADADSDLTYTATLANGSALPILALVRRDHSDVLRHAAAELHRRPRSQGHRQRRSAHRIRHVHADRHASQRRARRLCTDPRSGGLAGDELVVPGSYGRILRCGP